MDFKWIEKQKPVVLVKDAVVLCVYLSLLVVDVNRIQNGKTGNRKREDSMDK